MDSNLNLVRPFLMVLMRHWNSQAAVNCVYSSNLTQSWCETLCHRSLNCPHPWLKIQLVVTIVDNGFQSGPCKTIHDGSNEALEQSSCCGLHMLIQIYSLCCWNKRLYSQLIFSPPMTQKWACGGRCRQWIPISALSHHSLYSWWDIGTVKLLWIGLGNKLLYFTSTLLHITSVTPNFMWFSSFWRK